MKIHENKNYCEIFEKYKINSGKMENRVKYMDLPNFSSSRSISRSISPSSASSSSDLMYTNSSNINKTKTFTKHIKKTETNLSGDFTQSLDNLSNYSSDSSSSGDRTTTKFVNIGGDLTILTTHYYSSRDKKQRHSESVAIELDLCEKKKKKLEKRNKSLSSITKIFRGLSIKSTKSLTNTPVKQKKKESTQQAPKTILRRPVEYVHVKGMSGLTQRIPRTSICSQYS